MIVITSELNKNQCSFFFNRGDFKQKIIELDYPSASSEQLREGAKKLRDILQDFFNAIPEPLWLLDFSVTLDMALSCMSELLKTVDIKVTEKYES